MNRSQNMIHSVSGEIDAAEMRWIHPHEHLLLSMGEYRGETIAKYPGNAEYARRQIVVMLRELRQYGVTGLVDTTPMGIGRDEAYVEFAKSVSVASGVSVFLAAGLYVPSLWPPWATEWTTSQIGDLLTRELEDGIGSTGVRPALIKAAVARCVSNAAAPAAGGRVGTGVDRASRERCGVSVGTLQYRHPDHLTTATAHRRGPMSFAGARSRRVTRRAVAELATLVWLL